MRNESGRDGEKTMMRMYDEVRLFRLICDEVEKSLTLVDEDVVNAYADLVRDESIRDPILSLVRKELAMTEEAIRWLNGGKEFGTRFPRHRRSLLRRKPILKQVGLEQVALLREFREHRDQGGDDATLQKTLVPLLLSINCVAAGLGWTG